MSADVGWGGRGKKKKGTQSHLFNASRSEAHSGNVHVRTNATSAMAPAGCVLQRSATTRRRGTSESLCTHVHMYHA